MRYSPIVLPTLVLCALSVAFGQDASPLMLSKAVSFPGVQGGFNHMSVDAVRQRLFAAASTNTTLEIVDLKEGKPWRSLPGEKPAAARYAPEFDQLYVTRGQRLYMHHRSRSARWHAEQIRHLLPPTTFAG